MESYSLCSKIFVTGPSTENGNFPYVRVVLRIIVSECFSCAYSVVSTGMCNPELLALQMLGLIYHLPRMFQNGH